MTVSDGFSERVEALRDVAATIRERTRREQGLPPNMEGAALDRLAALLDVDGLAPLEKAS